MSLPVLSKDVILKLDGEAIAKVRSGTATGGKNPIDLNSINSEWEVWAAGMKNFGLDLEVLPILDDTEHDALWDDFVSDDNAGMPTLRLYLDATTYIHCDTVTDSDATCHVMNFTYAFSIGDAVVNSVSIKYSGPVTKTG